MSRPDLTWYAHRLRRMSISEVGHRTSDVARRRAWARRQVRADATPPPPTGIHEDRTFSSRLPESARALVPPDAAAAVVRAADKVLAGTWTVFGAVRADSAEPAWFYDPLTGRRAPDKEFAFRIDHRDESKTGNIKQVWEMSRHHHLTVLAAAWWLTHDERYAQAVADQLRSWWRANPFLTGVHWTSGIEAGVRLISWVWIRRLLDEWPKVDDLFEHDYDALRQIGWHQEFLAAFPSRGSSANNHVIAEAAGRLAAACAFPWYDQSAQWRASAAALLDRELAANTFPDGLNRELATDYHRFVLELGLVAAVEADAHGCALSEETWQCLARMLDAGAAILDTAGRAPRQGDGDEGRALILDDPNRDPWATALGTGSALLGAPSWWRPLDGSVQACLVGALGRKGTLPRRLPRSLPRPETRPTRFPDAGQVFLRSRTQDGPEIWCRCDGGPHGFLSIAAHAHADALSLEVRHDGIDILADPGTYCYHGEAEWRAWFRSTAGHNTVAVGDASQAESGGPFMWNTKPGTRTTTCDVGDQAVQAWSAVHDGYLRLSHPTLHRRSVTLNSPRRALTVVDTFDIAGEVALTMSWHLGPAVAVDLNGREATLTWQIGGDTRRGTLLLPDGLAWTAHAAETSPPAGWYSPRFGHRVPATSLVGQGRGSSSSRLVTVLELP
jgi:hypothetical protein